MKISAHALTYPSDIQTMAALALYESMGFRAIQDVLVFRKDYGEKNEG